MGKPAVIFDIGGVLVHCRWDAPAFLPLLSRASGENADIFLQFTADGMFAKLNTGEISPADFARDAIGRFGLDLDVDGFRAAWTGIFEPMDGMAELFAEVAAAGHPVTVLSDTDPWHWERLRADFPCLASVARPILSFELGKVKPAPALYRAAAAALERETADCVFMDDREPNVAGARAVGMRAFRFESADQARGELRRLGVLPA